MAVAKDFLVALSWLWLYTVVASFSDAPLQTILQQQPRAEKRIAIIGTINVPRIWNIWLTQVLGAGAAGTSTAYHLHRYADEANLPVHIAIYDDNPYIGGRTTTVHAYNDSKYPVELGGSIFVSVNHILQDAVRTFNLSFTDDLKPEEEDPDDLLGIWDGSSIRLTHATGSTTYPLEGWWRQLRLLVRYGAAPLRTQSLVKGVVDRFLKLYEWPLFPFANITSAVRSVSLDPITSTTGWDYLKENGLNGKFAWEIVQAATRVNYRSNLDDIHGVESMVSMATDGAVAVAGGNWQMFAAMANVSGASVYLDTHIDRVVNLGPTASGYALEASSALLPVPHEYDAVVLAAPFHQTEIDWSAADLSHIPKDDEYRELHVTLFTSALPLSRSYFNVSLLDAVPTTVLTTEPDCKNPSYTAGACTSSSPEFFSISTLRSITHPATNLHERLYKIFTPTPVSNEFLARILDLELETDGSISQGDISWIYHKKWLSYPREYPRSEFEPIRLDNGRTGEGIYYTASMEGFISTMETSALMGRNVARLMVNGWKEETENDAVKVTKSKLMGGDEL